MLKLTRALIPSISLLTVSTAFVPAQGNTPPLSLTLILLGFCCIFGLVIGVVVLGFIARRGNPEEKKDN